MSYPLLRTDNNDILGEPGARPSNSISIKFEIQSKFGTL